MNPIWERFCTAVERNPQKTAIICGEGSVTYGEIYERVINFNMSAWSSYIGETCIGTVELLIAAAKDGTAIHLGPRTDFHPQFATGTYLVVTTSGSTGAPKPILLSQQTKLRRIDYVADLYGVSEDDTILVSTPLYHSLAQRLVLMALTKGCTLVLLPQWSADNWVDAVLRQKSVFTMTVPAQLKGIADQIGEFSSALLESVNERVRCIVSSSAPLGDDLRQRLLNTFDCEMYECYGTTEVSVVTNKSLAADLPGVGWITRGCEVMIDGCEIFVKTPNIADNAPLVDGWFKTGDCGHFGTDGQLVLDGRVDDVINVGGSKVWPGDVEAVVRTLSGVLDCAAFGVPNETLGEVVAVAVVFDWMGLDQNSMRHIRAFCAPRLTDAQLPRYVMKADSIPRNAMGKLQRKTLQKLWNAVPTPPPDTGDIMKKGF